MSEKKKKLSCKHERFCHEYLVDYNATQAYIRAGYSPKNAQKNSWRLMEDDGIHARIRELQKGLYDRLREDEYKTLKKLYNLIYYDARQLFDEDGQLKNFRNLDEDIASVITGVKVRKQFGGKDEDGNAIFDDIVEVKLIDRLHALELMMRNQSILQPDSQTNINIGLGEAIRKARKRAGIARGGK